jgi:RNA polymerase sigma factor (sigma-70 family)
MDYSGSQKKERVLTPEEFDRFLASLDPDRERAGEKYIQIYGKLQLYFRWQGVSFPEDCVDETMYRVARKIAAGVEIRNPTGYFHDVARSVLKEYRRQGETETSIQAMMPASDISETHISESDLELERHYNCLNQSIQRLPPEDRELIMQYYKGNTRMKKGESHKELAERLGVSLNGLRIRTLRIRQKLRAYMDDCLKQSRSD